MEYRDPEIRRALDFILTSTDASRFVNIGGYEYDKALNRLIKSIEKSVKRSGIKEGKTLLDTLKSTVHYKFAEICKESDDEESWRELIKLEIPTYAKAPKHLLKYGGFTWHCNKFPISPYGSIEKLEKKELGKKETIICNKDALKVLEAGFSEKFNSLAEEIAFLKTSNSALNSALSEISKLNVDIKLYNLSKDIEIIYAILNALDVKYTPKGIADIIKVVRDE